METNLKMADGVFGRCQTCIQNMQKSICSMTCSSDQSSFMTPTITVHTPRKSLTIFLYLTSWKIVTNFIIVVLADGGENITYISSVAFEISERYVNETYDSCKGVTMPSTGGKVMDMACGGNYNSLTCSAKR